MEKSPELDLLMDKKQYVPDYSLSEQYKEILNKANIDPLFEEAANLIVNTQLGSTSLLQRKFCIGYNRAQRLIYYLERAEIVGPNRGTLPREVLCKDQENLIRIIKTALELFIKVRAKQAKRTMEEASTVYQHIVQSLEANQPVSLEGEMSSYKLEYIIRYITLLGNSLYAKEMDGSHTENE